MSTPVQPPTPKRHRALSPVQVVVIVFAASTIVGSFILVLRTNAPAIMVAILFAAGIAAFVYSFLGGIEGATLTVGALKLSGTMAALIGVALLVNSYLVTQLKFHLVRESDMVGEWRWVYAAGGWEGHLRFKKEGGRLTFTGNEFKWVNGKQEPLFDLDKGTATLVGGDRLELACDVFDHEDKTHFHWVGTGPFQLVPAFRGELRTQPDSNYRWGMMIYKWPPSTH